MLATRRRELLGRSLLAFAALTSAVCTACWSLEGGVREDFGVRVTCPTRRITIARRWDLERGAPEPGGGSPSKEISDDPERLAKWQHDQAALHEKWESDRAFTQWRKGVFEVSGCEQTKILECSSFRSTVSCEEVVSRPPMVGGARLY
jgi:hypothetical protein